MVRYRSKLLAKIFDSFGKFIKKLNTIKRITANMFDALTMHANNQILGRKEQSLAPIRFKWAQTNNV